MLVLPCGEEGDVLAAAVVIRVNEGGVIAAAFVELFNKLLNIFLPPIFRPDRRNLFLLFLLHHCEQPLPAQGGSPAGMEHSGGNGGKIRRNSQVIGVHHFGAGF